MKARPELKAVVAIIDGEDNPLWELYSIAIVPTVLLFDQGKVARRLDGKPLVGLRERDLTDALAELDGR